MDDANFLHQFSFLPNPNYQAGRDALLDGDPHIITLGFLPL